MRSQGCTLARAFLSEPRNYLFTIRAICRELDPIYIIGMDGLSVIREIYLTDIGVTVVVSTLDYHMAYTDEIHWVDID